MKGRGQGRRLNLVVADDQSVNTTAAIDGFRRLTQQENVVSVGGIIGSPIALATTRLAEEAKVPLFLTKAGNNEILTTSSRYTFRTCLPAAAMVATSVVQLAQRREHQERRRDHRRLRVGPVVQVVARGRGQDGAEHQVQRPGGAAADDELHAVPAAMGGVSLLVATGHPPGAGSILAQAQQLGIKAPVVGAYSPYSLTVRNAGDGGVRPLERLQVHGHGEPRRTRRSRSATCGRSRRTSSWRTTRSSGYAYVKIVAEAIRNVGAELAEDRRLRSRPHVQHPRVRVPAALDGVG